MAQDQTTLNDGAIQSTTTFQKLNRQPRCTHPINRIHYITIDQTYGPKGRPYRTSLPYNSCASEAEHYVTTTYDGADRGGERGHRRRRLSTYNGSQTTATDAAGVQRKSTMDGLGRLQQVIENPTGLAYVTSYGYDTLDDLESGPPVAQPRRTCTLQLAEATGHGEQPGKPEEGYGYYSGPTCLANYDGNGNLLSKVDANNRPTCYGKWTGSSFNPTAMTC